MPEIQQLNNMELNALKKVFVLTAVAALILCGCSEEKQNHNVYVLPGNSTANNQSSESVRNSSSTEKIEGNISFSSENPEESSSPESSSKPAVSSSFDKYGGVPERDKDGSIDDEDVKRTLSEEEKKFAEKSLFVGDSICKGLMTYNIVNPENVFATGSVATRNFFEMDFFYYGKNQKFADVLPERNPQNVLFSMGMNDVNMITSEKFCENYSEIIASVLDTTNADVYICAITPICCNFTPKERIAEFNAAIKAYINENYISRVHFVDFTEPLKNGEGRLKSYLSAGDGIHISPDAYYLAFHELYSELISNGYYKPNVVTHSSSSAESSETSSSAEQSAESSVYSDEFTSAEEQSSSDVDFII